MRLIIEIMTLQRQSFRYLLNTRLNGIKAQHIYEADYSYYLSMGIEGENASLICQFCGAPVDTAGSVCPYCGSEIHSSVERTWKVSRIYHAEIDKFKNPLG